KPGGWVFFSTLNRNPKSFLFAIIGAEYVLNLLPRGTHHSESFIKPSELARAARQADLKRQKITGLSSHPLDACYSLTAGRSVKYFVATASTRSRSRDTSTKLVLFDFDGTVADSAPDLANSANALRTERGMDPLGVDYLRPYASMGARGL